ncbi:hypothetical protein H8D91_02385 [archaeon]|nr:hypothetical protein [archaeon]
MKKLLMFGLVFLLLFTIVPMVFAATETETVVGQVEGINGNLDKIDELYNSDNKSQIATSYLKKEWGEVLDSKPVIGDLIRMYRKISPHTDPVFEWAVGIVPSLSWLFILTFLIWFTFVRYSAIVFDYIKETGLIIATSTVIYVAFMTIILVLQILQNISMWLANFLINLISITFGTWWGQTILVVGTIFVFVFLNVIQKMFRGFLTKWRTEKAQKKIKEVAKESEKDLKDKRKNEQLELDLK